MINSGKTDLPDGVTVGEAMDMWSHFLDGQTPFEIAPKFNRQQRSVDQAIAYVAERLGIAPTPVEAIRIIEHHHRSMARLNSLAVKFEKQIAQMDKAMASILAAELPKSEAVDWDDDPIEVVDISDKLGWLAVNKPKIFNAWLSLSNKKSQDVVALTKLHNEMRQVVGAVENVYGVKTLVATLNTPDPEQDDTPSALKQLSGAELDSLYKFAHKTNAAVSTTSKAGAKPAKVK